MKTLSNVLLALSVKPEKDIQCYIEAAPNCLKFLVAGKNKSTLARATLDSELFEDYICERRHGQEMNGGGDSQANEALLNTNPIQFALSLNTLLGVFLLSCNIMLNMMLIIILIMLTNIVLYCIDYNRMFNFIRFTFR